MADPIDAARQTSGPVSRPAVSGDRRSVGDDRRILHRGDRGRRLEDQPVTENALPPSDAAAAPDRPATYLTVLACTLVALWIGVISTNVVLNPLIYGTSGSARAARAFEAGHDYAVFDVNFDIRRLRRAHVARMTRTPEVVIIGASHWQEAHAELMPHHDVYNAHVHRDYVEDILAGVELFMANDRLPRTFIISIRDLTFLPVPSRPDERWLSYGPEYRQMARRLGLAAHPWWETVQWRKWLDLLSLRAAWQGSWRMLLAAEKPGPTDAVMLEDLDIVRRSGSVFWSRRRLEAFSPERAQREAAEDLALWRGREIAIDPSAVEALDRLLGLLGDEGVRVVLAHPPFHPHYYEGMRGTVYMNGLTRVTTITDDLARKHGLDVVGSFDPAAVGCEAAMFIDSNHSNPDCLRRIIDQIPQL